MSQNLSLPTLLKAMTDKGASDLHVTVGSPPRLRIDGDLVKLQTDPLTATETKTLCYSVMNDAQKLRFEEDLELDFSFGIRGMARFRANVYMQQACVAGAFRVVPYNVIPLADLGMPPVISELVDKPRGLVLVTGPTGSGKSTTLASMIDRINTTLKGHIVTVEDPIEFQHAHKSCLVNQREIGRDSASFKRALKYILRQDPDVVLSFVLEGVITQTLIPRASGTGRVLAAEVMVPNAAIRNLIREDKLHQIYSQMQIGQSKFGMQTMNQSLCDLYMKKLITLDDALARSSELDELKTMIMSAGGSLGSHAAPPQRGR